MMRKSYRIVLISIVWIATATLSAEAAIFDINLTFGTGLTATQQSIFTQAENYWESVLTGYQTGITISSLNISAVGEDIDGVGGILGSAGPQTGTVQAGYTLATSGSMRFDSADLDNMEASGSLQNVILHEMAHVIGFGTLWTYNNLYIDGSGEYTGANGLAAYRQEFDPLATYVPVELDGGSGTANGHWDELYGGAGPTGITNALGRDMRDELMTGWLNSSIFISNTTLMSFADLGYTVTLVPIPGSFSLLGAGLLFLMKNRKRRKNISV